MQATTSQNAYAAAVAELEPRPRVRVRIRATTSWSGSLPAAPVKRNALSERAQPWSTLTGKLSKDPPRLRVSPRPRNGTTERVFGLTESNAKRVLVAHGRSWSWTRPQPERLHR
jgi:hypothetical protein